MSKGATRFHPVTHTAYYIYMTTLQAPGFYLGLFGDDTVYM
jgi:hypothetical protein